MATSLLIVILLLAALAAILAGMAVFSNQRPPDPRLATMLDEIDEMKGLMNGIQKQLLQIERKLDKDMKESKNESREGMERIVERIERRLIEMAD